MTKRHCYKVFSPETDYDYVVYAESATEALCLVQERGVYFTYMRGGKGIDMYGINWYAVLMN